MPIQTPPVVWILAFVEQKWEKQVLLFESWQLGLIVPISGKQGWDQSGSVSIHGIMMDQNPNQNKK